MYAEYCYCDWLLTSLVTKSRDFFFFNDLMPATDLRKKAMAETTAKSTNVISAPIAKKRKLSPAEALIKSMTAKKAIAAQKQRPAGSHVTFGDNDEVIEKKAKIEDTDSKKKKPKKKKSKADKKAAATATTTSTSSIFQSDGTGSILPVHSCKHAVSRICQTVQNIMQPR
jgi:hypothetical protein